MYSVFALCGVATFASEMDLRLKQITFSFALFMLLVFRGLAVEPPANVVADPGFESGLASWIARGPVSLLVNTQAQSGANAGWITNRVASSNGIAQSLLGSLRPGGNYFAAAWARAESGTTQVLRLAFEQHDDAGPASSTSPARRSRTTRGHFFPAHFR